MGVRSGREREASLLDSLESFTRRNGWGGGNRDALMHCTQLVCMISLLHGWVHNMIFLLVVNEFSLSIKNCSSVHYSGSSVHSLYSATFFVPLLHFCSKLINLYPNFFHFIICKFRLENINTITTSIYVGVHVSFVITSTCS